MSEQTTEEGKATGATLRERVLATGLWAVVALGLCYGIVMTVIKASKLFA